MKKQFHRLGCVLRRLACELPVIFNWRILVGIAFFCALTARTTVEASSAVAVAVNSKGELGYGYYYDSEITEAEAQRRAIKQCLIWGGRKTRIIASTSKLGYGAVIRFLKSDKTLNFTATLAATTWKAALDQVKKQAKSLGGTTFTLARGWNDIPLERRKPVSMEKL